MFHRFSFTILLILTLMLPAHAQDLESVSRAIEALEADTSLDEESRTATRDILADARQVLAKANQRAAAVRSFVATASTAEQTLRDVRAELAALQQQPATDLPQSLNEDELNARLRELSAESAGLDATVLSLRERESRLRPRSDDIAAEIATARSELEELLETPPADAVGTNPVAVANDILHSAHVAERRAAIDDLAQERVTLAARQDIVTARLNLSAAQSTRTAESVAQLQQRLVTYRGEQARERVATIEQQLTTVSAASPVLRTFAQENLSLARANLNMIENYGALSVETTRLRQDLVRMTASAQTVDQVLATGQLNEATAEMLRDVRARLPNADELADAMARADQATVTLRLNLVLWQDRLRNIGTTGEAVNRTLADLDASEVTVSVRESAASLVDERRRLLQDVSDTARSRSDQMGAQKVLRQDLLERTRALAGALDRHLLWLPTKTGFGDAFVANLVSNFAWISSPGNWRDTGKAVVSGFRSLTKGPVLLAILALALGALKPTIRRRLDVLAARVGHVDTDTYMTTPQATLLTLLLPISWTLGIVAVGLAAMQAGGAGFTYAISQGILAMAAVVFILVFFRALGRNNGVFHRHFGWSEDALRMLRNNLTWFIAIEAVVAFIFTAAISSGDLVIKYGIGRLAFMVSAIAIAMFAYNFLKPRGGIIISIDADRRFTPIMKLLFAVLVGAPLIIGILPVVGYYEAAIELQSRIFQTGVITLLAAVIYRLSMRVFMVGHRRLMAKQAQDQREREQERRDADEEADQSGEASPSYVDEEHTDLVKISDQSRRAIFAISTFILLLGLWAIWGTLLPALGIADDVILWNGVRQVDGVDVSTGISLWDLSVALFLIIGGVVIARNIAGILELVVFERLNLVSGTRYAVTTIAKYVLISIGIVVGLSRLGVDWSSLQWVIAALGVGLGFGLQEIVANFVSGLIILFERPVRVGDVVTIGQLEGTVTSIQIRATRITDFDNREVLMPNKSIITENVTNWTLNDQVTRIILKFGVAYGSDIDQVRNLILDAVTKHPDTLATPSPTVFFMAHGDSSLDFEARVFVATPAKRLPVTHDLNRSINITLAGAGIEIPFPQRDLYIKKLGDLEPALAGDKS